MTIGKAVLPALAFCAVALTANLALALGFELSETKEELKLDYKTACTDHGTGRVTVVLTLRDAGRLEPLDAIDLMIPLETGTGAVDLSVSLQPQEIDGSRVVRVHLKREWAERAEIRLKTRHFDGKETPLTWYYHRIPLRDLLPKESQTPATPQ